MFSPKTAIWDFFWQALLGIAAFRLSHNKISSQKTGKKPPHNYIEADFKTYFPLIKLSFMQLVPQRRNLCTVQWNLLQSRKHLALASPVLLVIVNPNDSSHDYVVWFLYKLNLVFHQKVHFLFNLLFLFCLNVFFF